MFELSKNNKGLSLVELIIAMAILTIVGGGIVGFLNSGTNSYLSVSAESDIQKEAQLSMNQLSDLIINASKSLAKDPVTNNLVIFNDDHKYEVIFENAHNENKLYLERSEWDASSKSFSPPSDKALLADRVKDFDFEVPTEASPSDFVRVVMVFENAENKSYVKSETVNLRNRLFYTSDTSKLYETDTQASAVKSVEIGFSGVGTPGGGSALPSDIIAFANDIKNYTFEASVVGEDNASPSQDVYWKVEGKTDSKTQMIGNTKAKLQIGKDENNANLVVYAVSKQNPMVLSTQKINVRIKRVTGIRLLAESGSSEIGDTVAPNQIVSVRAEVHGDNLEANDKRLRWNFEGADNKNSLADGIEFQIKPESVDGTYFRVTATSVVNPSITASLSKEISKKIVRQVNVSVDGGNPFLKSGESYTFSANVVGDYLDANDKLVEWEYDVLKFVKISETGNKIVLKASITEDGPEEYTVKATLKKDRKKSGSLSGSIIRSNANLLLNADTDILNRGDTLIIKASPSESGETWGPDYTTDFSVESNDFFSSDYRLLSHNSGAKKLELLSRADKTKGGTVTVHCVLKHNGTPVDTASVVLTVHPVSCTIYNGETEDHNNVNSASNPLYIRRRYYKKVAVKILGIRKDKVKLDCDDATVKFTDNYSKIKISSNRSSLRLLSCELEWDNGVDDDDDIGKLYFRIIN